MFGKKFNITPSSFHTGKKICRNCGNEVDDGINFCPKCGNKKREFFHTYDDYLATTYKYCYNCGLVNLKGHKHCPHCGNSRFVSYDKWNSKKKPKPNNKKAFRKVLLILSTIITLALLIFGIWAIIQSGGEPWTYILTFFIAYSMILAIPLMIDGITGKEISHYIALVITLLSMYVFFLTFLLIDVSCGVGVGLGLTFNNIAGFISCMKRDGFEKPAKVYLFTSIVSAILFVLAIIFFTAGELIFAVSGEIV